MSEYTDTVSPVPVAGVMDPRVNVNAPVSYVAFKSGKYLTQKNYTTTSFSNSAWQFSCPPPSTNIIVDRLVWIKAYIQAVFDVDVRSTAGGLGINVGLRQFPLTTNIDTIQATINNVTLTQNIGDYVLAIMRYNYGKHKQDKNFSQTAAMADQFQDYASWQSIDYGGSARNPLASYGEQYYQNRGAILPTSISPDGKILQYTVMEPLLLLSPFIWDCEDENHMGYANVNTMDFNITFKNNLSRMFSVVSPSLDVPLPGAPAVTSITISYTQSPEMHFVYISPSDIMSIPRSLTYPYCQLERYVTNGQAVANGATAVVTSNNIQLNQIPKRIFAFLRQKNADQTFNSSDTFASILNVNVNFNNYSGLLSSMDQYDLYQISRKNGIDMSWVQFSNFCGSVLALDFGSDIAVSPVEAPGLLGNYNFQITINYKNTSNNAAGFINYDLYLIVCNEGTFEIKVGSGVPQTGVLSKEAILGSSNLPQMEYNEVKMQGGTVFGKLKSFVTGAAKGAREIGKIGQMVAPQYAPAFSALEQLGKAAGGRRKKKYYRRGRGLVGGNIDY
jgi:hypothetical protein